MDDIAWDQNPKNTFKKGDKDVSFLSYYKTVRALNCSNEAIAPKTQLNFIHVPVRKNIYFCKKRNNEVRYKY